MKSQEIHIFPAKITILGTNPILIGKRKPPAFFQKDFGKRDTHFFQCLTHSVSACRNGTSAPPACQCNLIDHMIFICYTNRQMLGIDQSHHFNIPPMISTVTIYLITIRNFQITLQSPLHVRRRNHRIHLRNQTNTATRIHRTGYEKRYY